ncbi:MAG: hypothetical protein J2P46_03500 [Zavarzinella sp.]|nr:hypothetical protein [Zavarzinella sp.]
MRGIRQWLTTAALVAGTSSAAAQRPASLPPPVSDFPSATDLPGGTVVGSSRAPASPYPPPALVPGSDPAIATALPSGRVVGSNRAPVANVTILSPAQSMTTAPLPPAAAATVVVPPPAGAPTIAPPVPNGPPMPGCGVPYPGGDCCGPVGANGPIGQEVYLRVGANFPLGNGLLARSLNTAGLTTQIGGRSQFFDPQGDAAWAVDVHLQYQYNNADAQDTVTFRGEPVFVRDLHRWAVGLGGGRDMFLTAPGFVGGTWDANFRIGWDVGARWGSGHVDLTPLFEPDGYRRHQDVFAQTFAGVMATMEVPVGGYTWICGGRLEWDYTFSDLIPKGSSFHEINTLVVLGVRY